MLTKAQKKQHIDLGADLIKKSKALVFADFTGVSIEEIRKLKQELKKAGAKFKVIKKRLLKLAFKNAGIDFDPTQFEAQAGTVFASGDIPSIASQIYKFSKDLAKSKKEFKILGAYDLVDKKAVGSDEFVVIAKLPSRETLLAMTIGGITGPLRAFMYIVNQLSKKTVEQKQVKSL